MNMKPEGRELIHHGVKGMKWGVRRTPEQLGRRPEGMKGSIRKKSPQTDAERAERIKEIEKRVSAPTTDKAYKKTRVSKLNKKLEDKAWKLASKSKVENSEDFHYLRKLKYKDELVKERSRDLAKALLKDIGMKKISDFDIDYITKTYM